MWLVRRLVAWLGIAQSGSGLTQFTFSLPSLSLNLYSSHNKVAKPRCLAMAATVDPLSALCEQKRALDAQLAVARTALTKQRKAGRKAGRATERRWALTERVRNTVLIIYVLATYTAEPAGVFLTRCAAERHWPRKSDEELAAMVEDLFLTVDVHDLAALTDTERPSDAAAMFEALTYVEQWRLASWGRDLNAKGVAPSTDAVLCRLEANLVALPDDIRPIATGSVAESRARKWAHRWRLRWGAQHGQIRARDTISVEEMRSKASMLMSMLMWSTASIFLNR